MSLTLRRNHAGAETQTWTDRMVTQARWAGQQLGPMAGQAKEVAAHRIEDARYWAAPRLEEAAHRVEDQLAPRVSAMLSQAAAKVDPTPPRSRRWPLAVLVAGVALSMAGYMFYRNRAQQWTEHMHDSAAEAAGKAEAEKVSGKQS